MRKRCRIAAALFAALPLAAAALPLVTALLPRAAAGQEAGGDVPVAEDLLAVLTLRGKPCERLVRYERVAEADYRVHCSDGHGYRIYVGDADRVIVVELEGE